jgi:hypothetical protein
MPEQSLLQNPVWHALISRQRDLGFRRRLAARYPADVSRFVGFETCTDEAFSDLAEIVDPTETVALATSDQPDVPAGWRVLRSRLLLQMVHRGSGTDAPPALTPLGASDAPEMLPLAAATKPGPSCPRQSGWAATSAYEHRAGGSRPWPGSASGWTATLRSARFAPILRSAAVAMQRRSCDHSCRRPMPKVARPSSMSKARSRPRGCMKLSASTRAATCTRPSSRATVFVVKRGGSMAFGLAGWR